MLKKNIFQPCTIPDAAQALLLSNSLSRGENVHWSSLSTTDSGKLRVSGRRGAETSWQPVLPTCSLRLKLERSGVQSPSGTHESVCRQTKEENPSRSPKAQEPAKGKRPTGRHCLSGCPAGRLRLGGQKLTGHISVVTAVAFDGGSRRCSVGARALVGYTCTCVCIKPPPSTGKVPDPRRSPPLIPPHPPPAIYAPQSHTRTGVPACNRVASGERPRKGEVEAIGWAGQEE